MKSKKLIAMLAGMSIMLTGCSMGAGIETLLQPPKLTEQQEQIYNALLNAGLSNINLKYPKSGSYLSAFTVANLDSESTDEAIVFYEKTGLTANDVSLRINVLDRVDGKWKSMHELPASGDEIEKVMISTLGTSNDINVIVGSSSQTAKNIDIYRYSDNFRLEKFTESISYSVSDVCDLDGDGSNELFIISAPTASFPAVAYCMQPDSGNALFKTSELAMGEADTGYNQPLYGTVYGNKTGIFVDCITGTSIHTKILTYSSDEAGAFTLSDLLAAIPEDEAKTVRPAEYVSKDIDGDGVIEIPVPASFPGYSKNPAGEQLQMVKWLVYEPNRTSNLTVKYQSYNNMNDGYSFTLPTKWHGKVTAKLDSSTNEIVFYKYSGVSSAMSSIPSDYFFVHGGEVGDDMTEIMRICVTDSENVTEKTKNGYDLIKPIGEKYYMVKIPKNSSDPLVPTLSEVALFNFTFN